MIDKLFIKGKKKKRKACVILQTDAVVENTRTHRLSSISKNVTNLAHAGRMTCRVQAWILIWPFTCFTIVFTSITEHSGTYELFKKKSLYKKSSHEILGSSRQVSKQVHQRFRRPRLVHIQPATIRLTGMCQQAGYPDTRRRYETNFLSSNPL